MLKKFGGVLVLAQVFFPCSLSVADSAPPQTAPSNNSVPSSYLPVVIHETFASILQRMSSAKEAINERQQQLLKQRYDLSNKPSKAVTMTNGKPIQEGVRVKLPEGVTWEQLANMSPEDIKKKTCFPKASYHFLIQIIQKGACYSRNSLLMKLKNRKTGI